MRESLEVFLKYQILPIYNAYDGAHDRKHVENVWEQAQKIGKMYDLNEEMCATMAAYHDLGMRFGRETHHITSARLLREDTRLKKWFRDDELEVMAQAILEHRASAETPPVSMYGKVLADADRELLPYRIVERTVQYGLRKFPNLSWDEQTERAYQHVKEKYGEEGYLSVYLPNDESAKMKEEICALLNDRAQFAELCKLARADVREGMSVQRYLERIGASGCEEVNAENLSKIQKAHLRSVPYENMDIIRGIPLILEAPKLYEKIVLRHRGGYCFELNELFGWLLRALGYWVTDCFARFLAGMQEIPKRRHHVLLVRIPGDDVPWLCDVGVGRGSPTCPVKLIPNTIQAQEDAVWKVTEDEFLGWVLWQKKSDGWQKVFSFTTEQQLPVDFQTTSYFCEHSEESPFNKQPMISLRTPTGRMTLDGNIARVFDGENVTEENVANVEHMLLERFGIE